MLKLKISVKEILNFKMEEFLIQTKKKYLIINKIS